MPAKQYRKPARTYEDIRAEWVGTKQRPGHLVAWWWTWKALTSKRWPFSVGASSLRIGFYVKNEGRGRRADDDDILGAGLKLSLDAAVVAGIWPDDGPSHVRVASAWVRDCAEGASMSVAVDADLVYSARLPKPLPTLNELIDAAKFSGMRMAQRKATVRR